jgi:hypothetical protein
MIEIPLTRGYVAIIDDEDEAVCRRRWSVRITRSNNRYALSNSEPVEGRRKTLLLHREILGVSDPNVFVDHIDGDGLNCRRENMRLVGRSLNGRNRAGPTLRNATSPYLGVSQHRTTGRWQAHIGVGNRTRYIGVFPTAEEANAARLLAERDLWGIAPQRRQAFADAGLL